jgi:hypothetical protein
MLSDKLFAIKFDRLTGEWSEHVWDSKSDVPRGRIGCASTQLRDGRIIVAGGYEDDEPGPHRYEIIPRASAYIIDPVTGVCEWLDDIPVPTGNVDSHVNIQTAGCNSEGLESSGTPMRGHCAGCLSPDGRQFIVSGGWVIERHVEFDDAYEESDEESDSTALVRRSVVALDLESKQWTELPPMLAPRANHQLLVAGGVMIALGGLQVASTHPIAEMYDAPARRWLPLPLPLRQHQGYVSDSTDARRVRAICAG